MMSLCLVAYDGRTNLQLKNTHMAVGLKI